MILCESERERERWRVQYLLVETCSQLYFTDKTAQYSIKSSSEISNSMTARFLGTLPESSQLEV